MFKKALILSDSRSALESINSHKTVYFNYLVPLIKAELEEARDSGLKVYLIWIPAHKGIWDNAIADDIAKRATLDGSKLSFIKIFFTMLKLFLKIDLNFLRERPVSNSCTIVYITLPLTNLGSTAARWTRRGLC